MVSVVRRADAEPAYRSLAKELRNAILRGDYSNGRRLPTESDLAQAHRLSRQTVRRAFQELVNEGMVQRVPGRGTFVAEREGHYLRQFGSVEDLMSLSVDTKMEVLEPLARRLDVDVAGRLRLQTDVVYRIVFRRVHDGVAFCHTTVSLPPDVARVLEGRPEVEQTGAVSDATVIGLYDDQLPTPIAEAEQSITASFAPQSVCEALGCDEKTPVLRIDRLYLSDSGTPVELAISYFLPDHYSYRLRLRRSHA